MTKRTNVDYVVEVVRERFNPEFVQQFALRSDSRLQAITDPIIVKIRRRPGESHPIDVYEAVWDTAKAQGLDVFGIEEDGTEFISNPAWNAAWKAAFAAAVAYQYSDQISDKERAVLVEPWESVVGAPGSD